MIIQLGLTLINIMLNTPDGVVVFLPSYAYMTSLMSIWNTSPVPWNSKLTVLELLKRGNKFLGAPKFNR